ncbi:hypothetical protein [Corallococcus sp. CA053C]|uniref:hypothetical protein n=1 Tax=Corallococcus sp. CA053C TaxID=2316732 RepID=UPI001315128E|nr:hypothetical protein [Corallococcus sp. CA053C]
MAEKEKTTREVLSDYFETHEVPPEVHAAWKTLDKTASSLALWIAADLARSRGLS